MIAVVLAAVAALGAVGVCYGIGLYRSEVKLPGDLQLALEVGRTRTTKVGNAVDRLGMRWAPLVLRLMGPARVNRIRTRIDHAGRRSGRR